MLISWATRGPQIWFLMHSMWIVTTKMKIPPRACNPPQQKTKTNKNKNQCLVVPVGSHMLVSKIKQTNKTQITQILTYVIYPHISHIPPYTVIYPHIPSYISYTSYTSKYLRIPSHSLKYLHILPYTSKYQILGIWGPTWDPQMFIPQTPGRFQRWEFHTTLPSMSPTGLVHPRGFKNY